MRKTSRVLMMVVVAACATADAAQQQPPQQATGSVAPFIQHPDNIQPGITLASRFASVTNPYDGNAARRDEGAKLFIGYNCVDCHGVDGSGAMGPSLADGRWHFGGSPGAVYESIAQGRPDGMPAWGSLLPPDQIWKLVSYVKSLESGKNVTTENFTGQTVERSGH